VPKARGAWLDRNAILALVVVGGGIVAVIAANMHESAGTTSSPAASPAPVAAPPQEEPNPVNAALATMDSLPLAGAFAMAKPYMKDTSEEVSPGMAVLALWAANRMKWSDVAVPQDETTFGLVQKDSSEQLGKRMCSAGTIAEIHTEKPETGGHIASGLLLSDAGHIYKFAAVGSSGSITTETHANLCGLVTGNFDYSNSAGGTGHAVEIVGMFDLPENAKPGR
jgi:hypothetical protein